MSEAKQTKPDHTARAPARSRWVLAFNLLMIVIFVTVVVGMLFPSTGKRFPSPASVSRIRVKSVNGALRAYRSSVGSFPSGSAAQIAEALQSTNEYGQYYLMGSGIFRNPPGPLLDGWKRPLRIILTNPAGPIVYSLGPNGRDDGGAPGSDDIVAP